MKNQIIAHFALNLGTLINKIDMHAIINTLHDNVKIYVMVHCLNKTLCLLAIDMSLSLNSLSLSSGIEKGEKGYTVSIFHPNCSAD